jgi:hypothetical protein
VRYKSGLSLNVFTNEIVFDFFVFVLFQYRVRLGIGRALLMIPLTAELKSDEGAETPNGEPTTIRGSPF